MGRWPAPWPERAYLIGIGGAAMSGLATLLAARGVRVAGSDGAVYPPASSTLAEAGIDVRTPYAAANLDRDAGLVIVGNAISRGNEELERALDLGLPLASMAEVIERLLVPGHRVTTVAGTHGKTTTSCLLAHLHHAAGRDPSFLVGGRPGNFESGSRCGAGEDLILEADEYDTAFFDKGPKFLHYWPTIAVLGPVEFDHADIYADQAAVERAFALYLRLIPPSGVLVLHADDPVASRLARGARCRIVTTGLDRAHDIAAIERVDGETGQHFELAKGGRIVARVSLALPGPHNARNAVAALAAAEAAGMRLEDAATHVARFEPPRRRLEVIARGPNGTAFDDFAHHPTAIALTLTTLRAQVPPEGRLIACLEPRSNTMVRAVVGAALEDALALADVILIGQVDRPERFPDDERLDVAALAERLRKRGREARGPLDARGIAQEVAARGHVHNRIVVMSNGAFGGLPSLLREMLS